MDENSLNSVIAASNSMVNAAGVINAANTNRRQRKWMEDMYERQLSDTRADTESARQYAIDTWNMQNDYNSPGAQMERMRFAGINPNNAASAIAGGSSLSSAPQPVIAPRSSVPNPPPDYLSGSLTNFARQLSEVANLNAQTSKLKAETAKTEAETDKVFVDAELVKEQLNHIVYENKFIQPQQVAQLEAIVEKTLSEKRLTDAEFSQAEEMTNKIIVETANLQKEYERLDEEINYIREREKTEGESRETMRSQQRLNDAEKRLADVKKRQQDLFNAYETELQSLGTSTQAASNPMINQRDQLGVLGARGVKELSKSAKNRSSFQQRYKRDGYSESMPNAGAVRNRSKYRLKGFAAKYVTDDED